MYRTPISAVALCRSAKPLQLLNQIKGKDQGHISPITEGAGHVVESSTVGQQVRLYYHQDLRGTVDYLTSPVSQKVESWTHYNEWGEITHNAVLKMGQRELDLVKNYTGHDFDAVLNLYYAKARMYDAENRRFHSVDPILDGTQHDLGEYVTEAVNFSAYVYVRDNPLIATAPLGKYFIVEHKDGAGKTYYQLEQEGFWESNFYAVLPHIPLIGDTATSIAQSTQGIVSGTGKQDFDLGAIIEAGEGIEDIFLIGSQAIGGIKPKDAVTTDSIKESTLIEILGDSGKQLASGLKKADLAVSIFGAMLDLNSAEKRQDEDQYLFELLEAVKAEGLWDGRSDNIAELVITAELIRDYIDTFPVDFSPFIELQCSEKLRSGHENYIAWQYTTTSRWHAQYNRATKSDEDTKPLEMHSIMRLKRS